MTNGEEIKKQKVILGTEKTEANEKTQIIFVLEIVYRDQLDSTV